MIPHRLYAIIEDHTIWAIKRFDCLQDAVEEAKFYYVNNPDAVECTFYPCKERDKYIDGVFYRYNHERKEWEKIEKVATVEENVELLKENVSHLYNQINPTIDIDDCTVKEAKEYYINKSKKDLDSYLLSHPLISTCHSNTPQTYTITKEKWDMFTSRLMIHEKRKAMNMSSIMLWNASGEKLEPWTDEECLMLINEWTFIIDALISYQQKIEKEIFDSETKEEILKVVIDYSSVDPRNNIN